MSSAGLRKQLALTTQRLQTYLGQLSDSDKGVGNEEEVEIMRNRVLRDISLLERGVEKINKTHEAWRELLAGLTGKAYEMENQKYEMECEASDGFLEVAEKGEEAIVALKCRLAEVEAIRKKSELPNVHQQEEKLTAELPRTTLPQFSGNPLEWRGFWDSFEVLVDKQPIPLVTKMTHLAGCLHGKAKDAIVGLPITNESYEEAKQILKKKFGDPAIVKRHLYRTLQTLPTSSDKTNDLKRFHDALAQACRELRALKEPLDSLPLVLSVLQKFPASILEEIMKDKMAQELDMELIKEALDKYLTEKEELASLLGSECRTSVRTEPQSIADFATALAVKESSGARGCVLCGSPHFADECLSFRTVASRKQRIVELKLCYRCLREGHIGRNCTFTRPCFYCRGNHHSALCQRREEVNLSWRSPVAEMHNQAGVQHQGRLQPSVPKATGGVSSTNWAQRQSDPAAEMGSTSKAETTRERQRTFRDSSSNTETDRHAQFKTNTAVVTSVQTKEIPFPQKTFPAGKPVEEDGKRGAPSTKVYLPTVRVEICNPNSENLSVLETYALFDSGSQRTFITSSIADRLGLSSVATEVISFNAFASKRTRKLESRLVQIGLRLKGGKTQVIEASAVPTLVSELVCRTWPRGQLGGETTGEEMVVAPGILIGSDCYWQLMGNSVPQRLVDDLYCIPTKVGPMIGGTIWNYQEPSNVIAAHMMSEVKPTEDMWRDAGKFWMEMDANTAANEEKGEELRSACAFVVKRERQDETERNKENVQKLAKEEVTDKKQLSEELEITASQKKTGKGKNSSKRSGRKTANKVSAVKDKSVRIVKDIFRIGIKGNTQEVQVASKGKQSEPSRSRYTKLRSARAKPMVLKGDDGKQKADSQKSIGSELAEKIPENNFIETVANGVDDKLKKEENDPAKSIERTQGNTTQRSLFISEATQSVNNWRKSASNKKINICMLVVSIMVCCRKETERPVNQLYPLEITAPIEPNDSEFQQLRRPSTRQQGKERGEVRKEPRKPGSPMPDSEV